MTLTNESRIINSKNIKRLLGLFFISAWGLALQAPAAAAIVTDRPDIAESSLALRSGAYQIEQATQYEAGGATGSFVFPSLHRLGVGHGVELRVETPVTRVMAGSAAFEEFALGTKWHVFDGGEWGEWPSLALLGHVAFDERGRAEPIFKLLADTCLPGEFELGLNVAASLPPEDGGAYGYALSCCHGVFGSLDAYAEIAGVERPLAPAAREFGVDGGFKYFFTPDAQLDVALYRGLAPGSPDWYLTSGLSLRWGQGD